MAEPHTRHRCQVQALTPYGGVADIGLSCTSCRPWAVHIDRPISLAELNQRATEHAGGQVNTYEEWRVTGKLRGLAPAVDEIIRGEEAARVWAAKFPSGRWIDGPHFQRRCVIVGDWEDAGAPHHGSVAPCPPVR